MQISNQMSMVTDWTSMHREKMREAETVPFKDTLERTRGARMSDRASGAKKAPYSYLADENGEIHYNGVTFYCDNEKNRLCLGDVSNMKNCISVGLSGGGSLVVNRDNLDDLAKAIGMFSPEDVNRIMRAISQDAMCRRKLQEIDEEENSIDEVQETDEEEEA